MFLKGNNNICPKYNKIIPINNNNKSLRIASALFIIVFDLTCICKIRANNDLGLCFVCIYKGCRGPQSYLNTEGYNVFHDVSYVLPYSQHVR